MIDFVEASQNTIHSQKYLGALNLGILLFCEEVTPLIQQHLSHVFYLILVFWHFEFLSLPKG